MKKLMLALALVLGMYSLGYCVDAITFPNPDNSYGRQAAQVHRINVVNGDPATITADAGVNCTGYKYAIVDVAVTGTTPSFTFIPLMYNPQASKYFQGTITNVVTNDRLIIEVDGSPSVFMRVDTLSGTTPVANIWITPSN